ncbi:MAG: hypothetical protein V8T07_00345 [Muribaculaceae bacterium]
MATLNAVIVPAKVLKGGRHKIRISVAHNAETRYIVTNIIIDSDKEFKNGAIVRRADAAILNTKLRGIIQRYQDVVDELPYVSMLSCAELICQLKNAGNDRCRTIDSVFNEMMESSNIKPTTRHQYQIIWNVVSKLIEQNLLVEAINHVTILNLVNKIKKRGVSDSTLYNYLIFVKSIINYAKKLGYAQYKVDPFVGIQMPHTERRDAWLTTDEIKKIRDLDIKRDIQRTYRDIFMLSYYLGGINLVDLAKINFNEQTGTIKYVRTKTENRPKINKYVEFEIPEEAKEIINRLKDRDGLVIKNYRYVTNYMRQVLRSIAEKTNIKKIIYYSARKSFAQHACELGVSNGVIDYILGHKLGGGGSTLYYYISVTPAQATAAIRLVLDNLK